MAAVEDSSLLIKNTKKELDGRVRGVLLSRRHEFKQYKTRQRSSSRFPFIRSHPSLRSNQNDWRDDSYSSIKSVAA